MEDYPTFSSSEWQAAISKVIQLWLDGHPSCGSRLSHILLNQFIVHLRESPVTNRKNTIWISQAVSQKQGYYTSTNIQKKKYTSVILLLRCVQQNFVGKKAQTLLKSFSKQATFYWSSRIKWPMKQVYCDCTFIQQFSIVSNRGVTVHRHAVWYVPWFWRHSSVWFRYSRGKNYGLLNKLLFLQIML